MLNPNSDETIRFIEVLMVRRDSLIAQLIKEESDRVRGKIQELNFIVRMITNGDNPPAE